MKKIIINSKYVILALSLMLAGCIEESPSVGKPFDRVGGLAGTWQLTKIIQNDEDAIRKGFPTTVQSLDVTALMSFTSYSLTLNVDEEGNPSTYVVNDGGAPNFVGSTGGSWELDDPLKPSNISFENGEVFDIETYLALTEGILSLKFTRYETNSKGEKKAFLSYQYQFTKNP